jgi:hypothetical protein
MSALSNADQSSKNDIAKRMFQNGIYRPVIKGDIE